MQDAQQGPSTVAPMKKKTLNRASFMGERCTQPKCGREFKIEKDWDEYRLTCPYCGRRVESTRILKQKLGAK